MKREKKPDRKSRPTPQSSPLKLFLRCAEHRHNWRQRDGALHSFCFDPIAEFQALICSFWRCCWSKAMCFSFTKKVQNAHIKYLMSPATAVKHSCYEDLLMWGSCFCNCMYDWGQLSILRCRGTDRAKQGAELEFMIILFHSHRMLWFCRSRT